MVDPAWLSVGFTAAGLGFAGALAIDTWVHKQGSDDSSLRRQSRLQAKQLHKIEQMIETANRISSQKQGEVLIKIGAVEQRLARLEGLEEGRHIHFRREDVVGS